MSSTFSALPEAPAFYPTEEEFLDPLAYLRNIRSEASLSGICKIIPPKGWDPPCLVSDNLRFNTTLQSTHKLKNRSPQPEVFMRRLRLFHRHERRMHRLQQESLAQQGQPTEKAPPRLKFPPRVSITDNKGTGVDLGELFEEVRRTRNGGNVPWGDVARNLRLYHPRNAKELAIIHELYLSKYEEKVETSGNQFLESFEKDLVERRHKEKFQYQSQAEVTAILCTKCRKGTDEDQMLLCDLCDSGWHLFCMTPPLHRLPPSNELWFCPNCDPKAGKEFGFDVGEDFTLEEFREYATAYKANWFHHPEEEPTHEEVETEYWNVSSTAERLVYTPYGSDLDTRDVGSGFPNPRIEEHVVDKYDKYLRCPWNLNIFPELNGSLLSYLTESIKGVTVPWLYVGMMFSSFCYHTEDSYMYSINYHHFGAPKIWYGTAGGQGAAHFEAAMRSCAPELFEANPGLFYHLTTMVSPLDLTSRGANIVRAVQRPGEYIVTFPQAYHGGFSTGFNCGEAVNFITADWIPFGRAASARYKIHKCEPVFCHEEIIIRAVLSPYFSRKTFPRDAKLLYNELSHIILRERNAREQMLQGLRLRKRVEPDVLKKYRCTECKQIPYLSAVEIRSEDARDKTVFCAEHWTTMLRTPGQDVLAIYSYTDDELSKALGKIKQVLYRSKATKKHPKEEPPNSRNDTIVID